MADKVNITSYTVMPKENLFGIVRKKYRLGDEEAINKKVHQIQANNHLNKSGTIFVGQILKLDNDLAVTSSALSTKQLANSDKELYVVMQNDKSLFNIVRKRYQITDIKVITAKVNKIVSDNHIKNSSKIFVGQHLKLDKNITQISPPHKNEISVASRTSKDIRTPYKGVIMLDPGHGGNDSGAVAHESGKVIAEKDINLKLAQKLGLILKNKGYKVVYTRLGTERNIEKDLAAQGYQIPSLVGENDTHKRVRAKDTIRPNLFLSIHCNSENGTSTHGVETYFFSNKDFASWKKTLPRTISADKLKNYNDLIKDENTLNTNSRYRNNKNWSTQLAIKNKIFAQRLQGELLATTHTITSSKAKNNNVIENNFAVITDSNVLDNIYVASALVETGYMSNPKDRKNLLNPTYQSKIAQGLASGIIKSFK